jgi:hypothetical protein
MSCITTNTLDMRSIYPVLDPRRTAGPGPSFAYGYNFASDGVEFDVNRLVGLPACEMFVNFTTTLTEGKQVTAFNLFNNGFTLSVGSSSLGLPSSMHIKKASCESGVDTIVLCRDYAWPQGMTAVYTFMPNDFWDFWGGCAINIRWVTDTMGSGLWGNQVPQPVYPLVRFPDGTVMVSPSGSGFLVIFGGAGFAADANFLAMAGLSGAPIVPSSFVPALPADFTLVREIHDKRIFVVFGGAKFLLPLFHSIFNVGSNFSFSPSPVRIIPTGGTAQLLTMPVDGTLLREEHDPKVFLADHGQLRWVVSLAAMDSNCLPWRHVRIVPDGTLTNLPHGPDIT